MLRKYLLLPFSPFSLCRTLRKSFCVGGQLLSVISASAVLFAALNEASALASMGSGQAPGLLSGQVSGQASAPSSVNALQNTLGDNSPSNANFNAGPGTKSYKDWKAEMVAGAQARLSFSRAQLENYYREHGRRSPSAASSGTEAGLDPQLERLNDQVQTDETYLSTTRSFKVSDYFVGYLSKQKSLKDAATKLSAEEVAELLGAYANQINQATSDSSKGSSRHKAGKSALDPQAL